MDKVIPRAEIVTKTQGLAEIVVSQGILRYGIIIDQNRINVHYLTILVYVTSDNSVKNIPFLEFSNCYYHSL